MTHPTLSLNDSLFKRLKAWSDERFPIAHAIAFFAIYLTAAAVSRYSAVEGAIGLSLFDVVGCLVTLSFFLVLRIFDEHKDYELDCMNHPQRVLQSGMITLKHLKILGALSILSQLLCSIWLDRGLGPVTIAWGIAFGWTCLMGKEFFCGEWLEKRLTLYAFSHMLVMPMMIYWFAQLGYPGVQLTSELILLMSFAFIGGFTAEIVRKTRGPEEERETVDSYSKIFGTKGSAVVVLLLLTVTSSLQAVLCYQIVEGSFWLGYLIIAAGYAGGLNSLIKFMKSPSLEGREKNEAMCGIALLLGYLVVIAAVIVERGLAWSLV